MNSTALNLDGNFWSQSSSVEDDEKNRKGLSVTDDEALAIIIICIIVALVLICIVIAWNILSKKHAEYAIQVQVSDFSLEKVSKKVGNIKRNKKNKYEVIQLSDKHRDAKTRKKKFIHKDRASISHDKKDYYTDTPRADQPLKSVSNDTFDSESDIDDYKNNINDINDDDSDIDDKVKISLPTDTNILNQNEKQNLMNVGGANVVAKRKVKKTKKDGYSTDSSNGTDDSGI